MSITTLSAAKNEQRAESKSVSFCDQIQLNTWNMKEM